MSNPFYIRIIVVYTTEYHIYTCIFFVVHLNCWRKKAFMVTMATASLSLLGAQWWSQQTRNNKTINNKIRNRARRRRRVLSRITSHGAPPASFIIIIIILLSCAPCPFIVCVSTWLYVGVLLDIILSNFGFCRTMCMFDVRLAWLADCSLNFTDVYNVNEDVVSGVVKRIKYP